MDRLNGPKGSFLFLCSGCFIKFVEQGLKRIIMSGVFVLMLPFSSLFASDLPVEHEVTRLLLAVESSLEDGQWLKAQSQLQSLSGLKVNLPEEFYYFNGLVMARQQQSAAALDNLERYVIDAGKDGAHYIEALKLITRLDDSLAKTESPPGSDKLVDKAVIVGTERDGYIKSLQALYLTDDPVKALVMQINSLLSAHGYTGSRVIKAHSQARVSYSLSTSGRDLIVQEKNYNQGVPVLTMSKLSVLGVDPYLDYDCSATELACWINHPGNKRVKWLKIDRDEMVISELSSALSKLILKLQQLDLVQD